MRFALPSYAAPGRRWARRWSAGQQRGRLGGDGADQAGQVAPDGGETGASLDPGFVHVEAPRHLDLQRVHALAWAAVVAGDVAAGIRVVAPHRVAEADEHLLDPAGDARGAGGAVRVAEHDIDRHRAAAPGTAMRRHRVAV